MTTWAKSKRSYRFILSDKLQRTETIITRTHTRGNIINTKHFGNLCRPSRRPIVCRAQHMVSPNCIQTRIENRGQVIQYITVYTVYCTYNILGTQRINRSMKKKKIEVLFYTKDLRVAVVRTHNAHAHVDVAFPRVLKYYLLYTHVLPVRLYLYIFTSP